MTYPQKIEKAVARIYWNGSAAEIERQVRAFNPAPGAFFEFQGERCKVLAAELVPANSAAGTVLDDALTVACGSGALRLTRLQRAGRPVMDAADLRRGWAIPAGTVLG